jgi:hypothetical protein
MTYRFIPILPVLAVAGASAATRDRVEVRLMTGNHALASTVRTDARHSHSDRTAT